jgi:hypothetical protein
VSGDFGARIWNPDLIQEGHWHHLALVWSRAVLKNSQFSLYIDGQLVYTGKVSASSINRSFKLIFISIFICIDALHITKSGRRSS